MIVDILMDSVLQEQMLEGQSDVFQIYHVFDVYLYHLVLSPESLAHEFDECFFQGTADAVRQYLWLFEEHNVMEFLVLAGDHLYRMDYERFIQAHRETDADITVAALPMDETRASAFGLMKIDEEGRIIEFAEKPKGEQLKAMRVTIYDLFTKLFSVGLAWIVCIGERIPYYWLMGPIHLYSTMNS